MYVWTSVCASLQYTMLCGHAPFYGQSLSTEEIILRIREGRFSCEGPEWAEVSNAAKDVIEGTQLIWKHSHVPLGKLEVQYLPPTPYRAADSRCPSPSDPDWPDLPSLANTSVGSLNPALYQLCPGQGERDCLRHQPYLPCLPSGHTCWFHPW